MIKMNRYALIAALAMFLSGCVVQREPAPVEGSEAGARTTRAAATAGIGCTNGANHTAAAGSD